MRFIGFLAFVLATNVFASGGFQFVAERTAVMEGLVAESISVPCGFDKEAGDLITQPSSQELELLARRLPAYLQRISQPAFKSLTRQHFQVTAFISKGRRVVCLNTFPGPSRYWPQSFDWRTHEVRVYDGGPHYWRLAFEIRSRRFSHFFINGRA